MCSCVCVCVCAALNTAIPTNIGKENLVRSASANRNQNSKKNPHSESLTKSKLWWWFSHDFLPLFLVLFNIVVFHRCSAFFNHIQSHAWTHLQVCWHTVLISFGFSSRKFGLSYFYIQWNTEWDGRDGYYCFCRCSGKWEEKFAQTFACLI